jgi:GH24 family phage-related lysozyme (muramidase)
MKTSVLDVFESFSIEFEAKIPWMYLDVKGLVTVGVGNLIDPMRAALSLPFVHRDSGALASLNEIIYEWRKMKVNQKLAQWGAKAAGKIASLVLTEESISQLVRSKLLSNEIEIRRWLHNWDNFPADAQLGILSMAWAMGSGFFKKFPQFTQACIVENWTIAAQECYINSTNNKGLIPRNHADRALFETAAEVVQGNMDPEHIWGWENSHV